MGGVTAGARSSRDPSCHVSCGAAYAYLYLNFKVTQLPTSCDQASSFALISLRIFYTCIIEVSLIWIDHEDESFNAYRLAI